MTNKMDYRFVPESEYVLFDPNLAGKDYLIVELLSEPYKGWLTQIEVVMDEEIENQTSLECEIIGIPNSVPKMPDEEINQHMNVISGILKQIVENAIDLAAAQLSKQTPDPTQE